MKYVYRPKLDRHLEVSTLAVEWIEIPMIAERYSVPPVSTLAVEWIEISVVPAG